MAKINGSEIGTHAALHLLHEYPTAKIVVENQHVTLSYVNSRGIHCWFNITTQTWYLIQPALQQVPSMNPEAEVFMHPHHLYCLIGK
jgi:hypothetical protein